MLKHFNHWLGRMLFFRLWIWLAVVRVDFKFVVSLADGFWACFILSVANHVKCILHCVKLYNVLNALCVIEVLSANNFLEKLSLVSILHRLQDSLIHRLNERGSCWKLDRECHVDFCIFLTPHELNFELLMKTKKKKKNEKECVKAVLYIFILEYSL